MSDATVAPNLTIVKYDRSTQMWQAVNGRVWEWPAGNDGRRQAELYALEHDCPEVAEEVKAVIANAEARRLEMFDAEAVTCRAIKAGFLVRGSHVLPPRPFAASGAYLNEVARVRSQSGKTWPDGSPVEYAITQSNADEPLWCGCKDFGDAPILPSGQRACKHILALLIVDVLESKDAPIPDIDEPICEWQPPQPRRPEAERDALREYAVWNELT